MNNIENSNFFSKIRDQFKNNFKYVIFLFFILLIIISSFYIYNYLIDKNIYKTSISYNSSKNLNSEEDFLKSMIEISKNKNFFGILASLDIINNNIENNNYNAAFNNYIKILEEKNLDKVYKSLISIHSSYNLIDNIEISKIYNLLKYYDQSVESFLGFYSEILFLLSILEKDDNKTIKLYNEILSNNKISEQIKQRVKKINEFEKNK